MALASFFLNCNAFAAAASVPESAQSPHTITQYHRRPFDLSAGAAQLSAIMGIDDELAALKSSQEAASDPRSIRSDSSQIQRLTMRLTLVEDLIAQSFEIRAIMAELDKEMSEAEDLQAFLENRRDKAIRLNTIANFISGGVTGIISGGIALGRVTDYAPNAIDTGEGVIQTSVALLALKQQTGERRLVEGVPNMLARMLDISPAVDYPPTVWKYLNSSSPDQSKTRRQILVEHWTKSGMLERAKGKGVRPNEHLHHMSGSKPQVLISIDLLDARAAMLTDLKAAISEMDVCLAEILQIVRRNR